MPKLILDVMGGDYGLRANLDGALQALPELSGELILVGDEKLILEAFAQDRHLKPLAQALNAETAPCIVRISHAPESIEMEDKIKAIRSKPGASINVGCKLARESWQAYKKEGKEPAAFLSSGHSGAMMASALLNMGRIKGVERPAIAVKLPSLSIDGCVILDVGANIECTPENLRDFAVMGALYSHVGRVSKAIPKVAVLSNGEERTKGTPLTRACVELIEKLPCFKGTDAIGEFHGYTEGKEIFKGHIDVVVTDGFTGNLILKSAEGFGSAIVHMIKAEAKKNPLAKIGMAIAAPVFFRLKKKLDYAETGAAPLLGIAGYAFVGHGRSNARAIKNALLSAQTALRSKFVERMEEAIAAQTAATAASSAAAARSADLTGAK
ncbi:MAG: phosphate acyltransferase PlsX [Methylotenera sp.]|nr:phosphate acyltransferase PlsX [Oligoflexia bacterium]